MSLNPRLAGARWRLTVDDVETTGPIRYGTSHDIQSYPNPGDRMPNPRHETLTVLPNTEFDELVVGSWLHVEQMDRGLWWVNVGGVTMTVKADRDGKPKRITVDGPELAVDGCEYEGV